MATLDYLITNAVHGTRAADNFLLDWEDVMADPVLLKGVRKVLTRWSVVIFHAKQVAICP